MAAIHFLSKENPSVQNLLHAHHVILTRREIPKCTYIEFPDHPYLRFRQPCNSTLLNSTLIKGKLKLIPKIYTIFME